MKKIININLSGRVIPIEDSAYEKLQAYIESLRRYFAKEEGRDEIINDIESRIAELMSEKIRKGATSITDDDVEEIAASMGRPADLAAEAEEMQESAQQGTQQQYSSTEKRSKRRLYRDSSDKFIGGVCSGIAAYLNVDPTIVRILFAIITFGGFGLGFLAYILLWIVLPTKDLEGFSGKRLYRNPDDRVIGGVAGGLAAYFNKKATIIRLIFAAPIALSLLFGIIKGFTWHYDFDVVPNIVFSSLSGTFILAYVILWMVLPEARSTYEKMEMRGEKVDVNSIRQNVKEGMDNVKDRMKGWSEEVKESAQNFSSKAKEFANTRGKQFADEVNDTARRGGRGIGHAIAVLFKVFFLFIAGTIAFALFIALIALIFGGVAWWPINGFLWTSSWQQAYAWGTAIFFFGVPLIAFIVWVIRRILRVRRSRHSYLGWTFGFLWMLGWVAGVLFAASLSKDFREYEHTDTPIIMSQPVKDKLIVAVSQPALEYSGNFDWIDDAEGWDLSADTFRLSTIRFDIKPSTDSFYHVTMKKYSYGRTEEEAIRRAEKIRYNVSVKDSILDLGNGYAIDRESKFRLQQVEIQILVPINKKIRFDASVPDKLNPADLKIKKNYHRRIVINGRRVSEYSSNDNYFHYRTDVDYTMGIDGNLKDPNGRSVSASNYYRYNDNDVNNDSLERQERLQEEKRKREESDSIIKQLEQESKDDQQKKENKPTSFKPAKKKTYLEEKNGVAMNLIPVLSQTQWF